MKRFALADCNNFFVSCERVFDPKLIGKPVVVLSNNDGCVIARSNEAKKIGIKMGEPAFMCKTLFKKHNVLVLSSNFALYSDLSSRVMQILSDYATDIEIYSVDEAFLHVPDSVNYSDSFVHDYAQLIRLKVKQNCGIPISIGLAPTKTLAKLANSIAKKNSTYQGVFDLTNHPEFDAILQATKVEDIWGIGRRFRDFLNKHNIRNAYELKNANEDWIRKNMSITGLKTVLELRGTSCLEIQEMEDLKKSITVSRSFGKNVTAMAELQEATAHHMTRAAEKLRDQDSIAGIVTVFAGFITEGSKRAYTSATVELPMATNYTPELIRAAHECIDQLFTHGTVYKNVGVILQQFYDADQMQMHTVQPCLDLNKRAELMKTIDTINSIMGKNTLFFASSGTRREWQQKKALKSPEYTTNWNDILKIKI